MSARQSKPEKGIEVRTRADGTQSFRGHAFDARANDGRGGRIRSPWFPTVAQARNWRQDTQVGLRQGTVRAPVALTLREAAAEFIDGARAGHVLNRKGEAYRPSVTRDYEGDLRRHVLPTLGDHRLSDLRRGDVQGLVDRLTESGLAPSTVRNALDPLRRICDRAVKRDVLAFSPCQHLELPRGTGTRERVATPTDAAALIAALPVPDRALWATAFYAGLRVGELRALRCSEVELRGGVLRIVRSWDDVEGEQDGGKSKAAKRTVMLIEELRPILAEHLLVTGKRGDDLVFGRTADEAEDRTTIRRRARAAWTRAGLRAITPHECRHTFGSMLAAAGVDVSERQRQMGHGSSAMMDRYTHGIDGSVAEAGERLQAWLDGRREASA
jgi:integrase